MKRTFWLFSLIVLLASFAATKTTYANDSQQGHPNHDDTLQAQVIAVGIPGAGAVAEVGNFLTGSPMHDKPAFTPFAQPGQVLDPKRILVASTSNFNAPVTRVSDPEGTVLSIDPNSENIAIPSDFAGAGGQASALNGAVQVYAAQSPAFLNTDLNIIPNRNPSAVTPDLPSVSLPLGISINSGNGRPWVANAPNGSAGYGTITVLDPQGYPLTGAPDPVAGGVFAGNLTNRNNDPTIHGLASAALGTAIITKSPDLTGRAVFVAVEADGSVAQINVLKGVDDLAPPGTVTPVAIVDRNAAESNSPNIIVREGIVFNWVPTRNVFIADPQANRLVVLDLTDDGTLFHATTRHIKSQDFNIPIDLAPTTREIAAGSFASNTTLGGGSDIYVLNRGNNSIVRMGIDGEVQAKRTIQADLPDFRVNGIAVSSDGQTLYVTATTPNSGGVLMAAPAFGGPSSTSQFLAQAKAAGKGNNITDYSAFLFSLDVTPAQGLGPLFNRSSCDGCHISPMIGGMGSGQDDQFIGRIRQGGSFDPLTGHGGPVVRTHSIAELGVPCALPVGTPPNANVSSIRSAMTLRGNGLIDDIAPGDIIANMATEPDAMRGHPNILADGRIGKFGWKANVATLVEFMGGAFRNEMGLTNPLQPQDEVKGCGANHDGKPEVDSLTLEATANFLNSIDPPTPPAACASLPGAALFQSVGCAGCHTPSLPGPGARVKVNLYSDLLLHDMGPALADQMQQGLAQGSEWRTMPLWKVSERSKFLHDGRATTLTDAISAHGGQAQAVRDAFMEWLVESDKKALLDFLGCI